MMIRTALSAEARAELVTFCADNLRPGLDPEAYAGGLEGEVDMTDGALFEVRGFHSKTGNPTTIQFLADADFCWEEVE
jgi:hypothetical protein